ncbi:hypothetical protein FKM82_028186 [Ascaphus truei]
MLVWSTVKMTSDKFTTVSSSETAVCVTSFSLCSDNVACRAVFLRPLLVLLLRCCFGHLCLKKVLCHQSQHFVGHLRPRIRLQKT